MSRPEDPRTQDGILRNLLRRMRQMEVHRHPFVQTFFQRTPCIDLYGSGSETDPYLLAPKISDDPTNILECTDDGMFVPTPDPALAEFDAIVDGSIAATDTTASPPIFKTSPGEACAYLDSLGLESVNVLVRNNDPSGSSTSGNIAYTETADWNSPSSVHLFGLRGGEAGSQFETGIYWDMAGFRPLSSRFAPPNYYIHNFQKWTISACATQKFGMLSLYNVGLCEWGGVWTARLADRVIINNSVLRNYQSKTLALKTWMFNTDYIVGGLSGGSATHTPGTQFFKFHGGDLMNESASGTISLQLPAVFDIEMYESVSENRFGTFAGQVLNFLCPASANGRLHVMSAAFTPGASTFTASSTTDFLDLRGGFGNINIASCGQLIMDVSCGDLTIGNAPALVPAPLVRAQVAGNLDVAHVALDVAIGGANRTVTIRNCVTGVINTRSVTLSAGTFLNFVASVASHVMVGYNEVNATGTAKPYAFDGSSRDNVLIMQSTTEWPVAGTGAGGTNDNVVFPEDYSLASAVAPANADYLVGTANAGLSAEIVVGTTPGGELGNTWGSPTVDTIHSGSAHSDFIPLAGAPTGWGSITNVTPDQAYDADSTTVDELADVLGTLVADLIARGVLDA